MPYKIPRTVYLSILEKSISNLTPLLHCLSIYQFAIIPFLSHLKETPQQLSNSDAIYIGYKSR